MNTFGFMIRPNRNTNTNIGVIVTFKIQGQFVNEMLMRSLTMVD